MKLIKRSIVVVATMVLSAILSTILSTVFVAGVSTILSTAISQSAIGQATTEPPRSVGNRQDSQKADLQEKRRKKREDKKQLEDQLRRFLRVKTDADKKPIAMQTSITRYIKQLENGDKLYVDLIGVIHIGEKEYYDELNEIFEDYDAMLYELVAPEGTRIPKGGRGDDGLNPLAAMQNAMKSVLELDFQLDHIDYMKNNLVHADMSPEEFAASMEKNEESLMGMFFKAVGQSLAMQGRSGPSDADFALALMSNNRTMKLRQMAAEQMQDLESGMIIFEGKNGSTIINHRNRKAFTILDREIEKGNRKIGVFYGAGHLPDMETILTKERGMQRAGQYWLDAWMLREK